MDICRALCVVSSYGPKAGNGEDDGFDITLSFIMAGSRNFGFRFFVEVPFEISGVEHSKDLIPYRLF